MSDIRTTTKTVNTARVKVLVSARVERLFHNACLKVTTISVCSLSKSIAPGLDEELNIVT